MTVPCIIVLDAEERHGERDLAGNWTPRPRYDVARDIKLPCRPWKGMRLTGLFPTHQPDGPPRCMDFPDDQDDAFQGWKVEIVTFDVQRRLFVLRLFMELLLPWETEPTNLPVLYPGWTFTLNEQRSKGFDPMAVKP